MKQYELKLQERNRVYRNRKAIDVLKEINPKNISDDDYIKLVEIGTKYKGIK